MARSPACCAVPGSRSTPRSGSTRTSQAPRASSSPAGPQGPDSEDHQNQECERCGCREDRSQPHLHTVRDSVQGHAHAHHRARRRRGSSDGNRPGMARAAATFANRAALPISKGSRLRRRVPGIRVTHLAAVRASDHADDTESPCGGRCSAVPPGCRTRTRPLPRHRRTPAQRVPGPRRPTAA